jgi:hypothetical protein
MHRERRQDEDDLIQDFQKTVEVRTMLNSNGKECCKYLTSPASSAYGAFALLMRAMKVISLYYYVLPDFASFVEVMISP